MLTDAKPSRSHRSMCRISVPPLYPTNLGLFRLPEPIRDIPQSITVIPQELMQEQAVTSFRDALRNVTGISLAAGEGGGAQGDNLTLRGFNARNDYFLDGIRDQGSYTRDVFNLEAIEVLKGPSAVLFGRGSTGGVINQVSKTPRLEPLYTASVSVGTGQLLRGTADINQPLSKTVALRVKLLALRCRDRRPRRGRRAAFWLGALHYFWPWHTHAIDFELPGAKRGQHSRLRHPLPVW